jgi:hypothetical protein
MILANAFSLQMLDLSLGHQVKITPLTVGEVKDLLAGGFTSAIGHPDTAAVVGDIVGIDVPMNRINIKLDTGITLIVAQLTGGRLPEGATTLPEGFSIKFVKVEVL